MSELNLQDKKFLIIDVLPEMSTITRTIVEKLGCINVVLAGNGDEAIEVMLKQSFDIILCDYNLGKDKDGQQVLEEARHRNILSHSSIFIIVTAESNAKMVMGALESQPDDYLARPLNQDVLEKRLHALIDKKAKMALIHQAIDKHQYNDVIMLCDAEIEKNKNKKNKFQKIKSDTLLQMGEYDAVENLCMYVLGERYVQWAMFDLGRVFYHRKQYDDAVVIFSKLVNQNKEFIPGYDWLAKAQEKIGNINGAQRTLEDAIDLSPKALLRQRALAEVAEKNSDIRTVERARRRALEVGKGSILRESSDFTCLAKAYKMNNSPKDALSTVQSMEDEYQDDPRAQLDASTTLCSIYKSMGDVKNYESTFIKAIKLSQEHPEHISAEIGMELAENCIQNGNQMEADRLLETVIQNNHEDESVMNMVSKIYNQSANTERANKFIKDVKDNIVKINNEGVELIRQGKIDQSIELFVKAAKAMPRNPIINLNAAQSMIVKMKKGKPTRDDIATAMNHIDRARGMEGYQAWLNKLMSECHKLIDKV